jgi:ArsR family transcriptional regulator, arsenate/arsenite/antimonite-responsive transcriptional repressor
MHRQQTLPKKTAAAAPPPADCVPKRGLRSRHTKPYAQLFKALGDETRLEIVGLLAADRRELCACDIEGHFDLSQPTVSHHLKVLRDAGLVTFERRGKWLYYSLARGALDSLAAFKGLIAR